LGQTVGVRDHPEAIAEVFGGTLLLAVAIGFLYGRNKRAWCRHACPIGLLLGIFSRLGAVQFAPKRKKEGGDRATGKGVCPTFIDIPRKEESRHCIECFRCVRPGARGGLFLRLRRPGEEIERIAEHHPNPAEIAFLFLGTGVVLGGFLWLVLPSFQELRQGLGAWFVAQGHDWIGESGPWWLMSVHPERREVFNWLDFMLISGYMTAWMVGIGLLLSVVTGLAAWSARRLGGAGRFVELGYQYAPVAMVSLVIGLGTELFAPLAVFGPAAPGAGKAVLFGLGLAWSLFLGFRILGRQGLPLARRWLPMVPGAVGSLAVGAAWWPALFGV
ncbi:MAG TPA: 4Fe-4S binding protein, partial [Gammaproteobacteria bacterium]|nr:4Fe-4S binding protein [Gammaproteobacteria bacterium]